MLNENSSDIIVDVSSTSLFILLFLKKQTTSTTTNLRLHLCHSDGSVYKYQFSLLSNSNNNCSIEKYKRAYLK
ncbi:unnamed protein product [Rotaria socialis]